MFCGILRSTSASTLNKLLELVMRLSMLKTGDDSRCPAQASPPLGKYWHLSKLATCLEVIACMIRVIKGTMSKLDFVQVDTACSKFVCTIVEFAEPGS